MSTQVLRKNEIKTGWHKVDAKGKILGRLATEVATVLTGKNKPQYVPYLDNGDHVVVVNAASVKTTGKKETQKVYFRHSGFPGGDKKETLAKLRLRKPEEVIRHAVWGMMPKNKLGKKMIKKLHVFSGTTHSYQDKIKEAKSDA